MWVGGGGGGGVDNIIVIFQICAILTKINNFLNFLFPH